MGTIITSLGDLGYEHEGYVGHVLDDGTVSGTWSNETRPHITAQRRAACSCEWVGERVWTTDADTPDGFNSEKLDDEILTEWETHVYALAAAAGITPTKHVDVDHRAAADKAIRAFRDAAGTAVNTVVNAGPVAAWPFPADVDDTIAAAAEILPYLRHLLSAAQNRLEGLAQGDARLRTTKDIPAGMVALGAARHLTAVIEGIELHERILNDVRNQTSTLGYTWVDTDDDEEE